MPNFIHCHTPQSICTTFHLHRWYKYYCITHILELCINLFIRFTSGTPYTHLRSVLPSGLDSTLYSSNLNTGGSIRVWRKLETDRWPFCLSGIYCCPAFRSVGLEVELHVFTGRPAAGTSPNAHMSSTLFNWTKHKWHSGATLTVVFVGVIKEVLCSQDVFTEPNSTITEATSSKCCTID